MYKIINYFYGLDKIQKTILILLLLIFSFLFIENFIFSSSFDILMFRSVDDFAFQEFLRETHKNITQFRIEKLFQLYSYGYGWLFWIIHVAITFPFYFLSIAGYDFMLIAIARDISLFFMIGSCWFLFKIIKIYTKDRYIPYVALLLFVSYPYFAFCATSFRTIAQTCFFCILTFYFVVRNATLNKRDLKYIAISLSACLGVKLNTAIFMPFIALLLADRFGFKLTKENFKNGIYFLKYLIPTSLFFINPSLLLAPFKPKLFEDYFAVIQDCFKNIHTNYGYDPGFARKFNEAFLGNFLHQYILIFFAILFLIKIIFDIKNHKTRHFDSLYVLLFLVLCAVYLCLTIKMGSGYITNYFASFSFLIIFPIVVLDRVKIFLRYLILTSLLIISLALNFYKIKQYYFEYYIKYNSKEIQDSLIYQRELKALVKISGNKNLSFLIDYRAPIIYSNFRGGISMTVFFDNISLFEKNYSKLGFDYILLHKDSIIMANDNDFARMSQNIDSNVRQTLIESRKVVSSLVLSNEFGNFKYKPIYIKDKLIFFQKFK